MDRKTALLAAGLLLALVLACVLASLLPQGQEDVTFEYQAFLKEVGYDAEGDPAFLVCALFSDQSSTIIVSLEKVKHAYTPSGKTSFKKLNAGDLLFISADPQGGAPEGDPPVVVADVVMVKSVGVPDSGR